MAKGRAEQPAQQAGVKQYFVETPSGSRVLVAATQPAGPLYHYLDFGPTFGRRLGTSAAVTGNVVYFVDNGPTLGRQRSAT